MATKKTGGLNKAKGLDALITANRANSAANAGSIYLKKANAEKEQILAETDGTVLKVKLSSVVPNREQPRKKFDEVSLKELADSISQYGVIVPLIVQQKGKYYEIIAGERRWRAAKIAGIKEIPVLVKEYSEREVAEISLIENIQREDLNPIEEANAYRQLIEDYELTQEEVAKKVSKSRSAVTNSLRLLKLDERVRKLLIDDLLTMGHARALLAIENPEAQFDVANTIILRQMSVRETESYVKRLLKQPKEKVETDTLQEDTLYEQLEERLKVLFGTKTSINRKKSGKGSIVIEYYSQQELERLLELINTIQTKG